MNLFQIIYQIMKMKKIKKELDNLKDKNESNFRNEKSIDDLFLK